MTQQEPARASWDALEAPWRAAIEMAWQSYRDGGIAVGAVLADAAGAALGEGRSARRPAASWIRSNGPGEVAGVAIGIGDVSNSLSPWHVVRLAADAPAQGPHPLRRATGIVVCDGEENPARSTGSALGVGDQAQFRVTGLEAGTKRPDPRRARGTSAWLPAALYRKPAGGSGPRS